MAEHDSITDRLDVLRDDVDRLRLPSPAVVRKRGDVRRTRRSAAVGLAAVLVLAVGAGVVVGAMGVDRGSHQSVATPPAATASSTSTTASTTGSTETASPARPTPTTVSATQVAQVALLPATALDPDAVAERRLPGTDLNPCRYDNDQSHDVVLWQVISTTAGAEVHQRVIVWPDAVAAKEHWVSVHDDLAACSVTGRYGPLTVSPMGPLADGWVIELPSGAAPTQVYAAGFLRGRVTSEIYFTDPSAPAGAESVRQSHFHALATAAAARLADAVEGNSPPDETATTPLPSNSP